MSATRNGVLWIALAIAGLSFWFWIGFPFANHNESYAWIAQFERMNLHDALTRHLIGVANWRPLGTGWAWILWHGAHGSIAGVELLNYVLAAAAWAWLAWRMMSCRLFAIAAFLVGGALFSGYVYLFHLHGIFYSPLLVFLALLLGARTGQGTCGLVIGFVMAATTALFHPFALPLYAAFVAGSWLERRVPLWASALTIVACGGLSVLLLAGGRPVPMGPETWSGLSFSYRMVEIHPAVTGVVMLLIAATVATTRLGIVARWIAGSALVLLAGILGAAGGSALPVWILACLIKLAREGRWSWMAMLALAAIFPIAYPTGSPTYTVPALFIATATFGFHSDAWRVRLARIPAFAPALVLALVIVVACAIRAGADVPLVSRLADPLLAERERTFQMEAALRWVLQSPYRTHPLALYREARSPNEAQNAVERRHRPPTQQAHLGPYLREKRGEPAGSDSLYISFGSEAVPAGTLLLALPGRFAGEARVYGRPAPTIP